MNNDLLRGELGFNGLVVSDATPMAGLTGFSAREIHVPQVIENGCDVFLFATDDEQDYQFMLKGLREKRLSEQRLEDAVTRAPAYINAYSTTVASQFAAVERMLGEKPFEGTSPVGAFAGAPDAKY